MGCGLYKAKKEEKKADEKKPEEPKEPAVSTVVLKINLHCDGCARKIKKVVKKNIDGVKSVDTDMAKDLVTVTGTMNVTLLTAYLKEKFKRAVDILPPKKDDGGGDKKGKEGEKKDGEKKEDKKEGGEGPKNADVAKAVEVNKLDYNFNPQTHYAMAPMYNQNFYNQDYGLPMYHHQGYPAGPSTSYAMQYAQAPAPPPPTYINQNMNDQMFSDDNPNGCSVM